MEWNQKQLDDSRFGGKSFSGSLDDCYYFVRLCAATEGMTQEVNSRNCLLTLDKPYTPLLSTNDDKNMALPAPLRFFEGNKVCSDVLSIGFECIDPIQVWFPSLPDKDLDSLAYHTCCTPPKTCPNGSELCRSVCNAESLCAWLEFSKGDPASLHTV